MGANKSSSKQSSPRTISFTVPTMSRPQFKRPTDGRLRHGLLAVAFILTAVIAGYGGAVLENHNSDLGLGTTSLSGQKIVTGESKLISQIAKNLSPSVVSVNVDVTTTSTDSLGSLFGYTTPTTQQAAGTGIIISSKGIIVTNRHVVPAGTTKISVTLSDGTELKDVSVVGRTAETDSLDVAILKVNDAKGHKLVPATIGDSSNIQVGDNVVAIGNALGQFQNSVTSGIVSGYGRSIQASDSGSSSSSESLADLIQTDAAINSGNSGGPLVNLNGQVIGINTAVAGSGAQNIGFSIPVNDIKGIINQVLKTGKFERAYLGVHYVMLTADVAYQYNLPVSSGAYIAPSADGSSPIVSGSPAEKAGLQEKDIITAVDGTKLDQTHSLLSLLGQHSVGDSIKLTVVRDGKTVTIDATLEAAPSS
ncbi:MAG: putative HtrA2 peptidase [Candidatus Saccharibacteria bacterium]|nr:putative HtrA2 peptidase [Candidatus Saccharibacteria bacterium]